jgi:glycosyltransferase involved in cell wall biosynthesis
MPDLLVLSALVPKALGAKIVLDLHDPMPELSMAIFGLAPGSRAVRLLRRLERWSIAVADSVLTVNLACKSIFASRSAPPGKVEVVMNAPDETIFGFRAPDGIPARSGRLVIMCHGSLVERHGQDLAVVALDAVRRTVPAAELRIYGPATPFLERVMDEVRQRGLESAVRYLGGKDLEEIVAAIDACDVGIIPNRRTLFTEINTPTRIFEYLARGKPVITGRAPGVRDYFPDESLFFFELGNAEDLARQILRVFHHPEEAQQVVRRGQAVYLAHRWSAERQVFLRRAAALLNGSARAPAGAPQDGNRG